MPLIVSLRAGGPAGLGRLVLPLELHPLPVHGHRARAPAEVGREPQVEPSPLSATLRGQRRPLGEHGAAPCARQGQCRTPDTYLVPHAWGGNIPYAGHIDSAADCASLCRLVPSCAHFSWLRSSRRCLQGAHDVRRGRSADRRTADAALPAGLRQRRVRLLRRGAPRSARPGRAGARRPLRGGMLRGWRRSDRRAPSQPRMDRMKAARACRDVWTRSPRTNLISRDRLPLSARGRDVVDRAGVPVRLACVNWSGAHMKQFVPGGLQERPVARPRGPDRRPGLQLRPPAVLPRPLAPQPRRRSERRRRLAKPVLLESGAGAAAAATRRSWRPRLRRDGARPVAALCAAVDGGVHTLQLTPGAPAMRLDRHRRRHQLLPVERFDPSWQFYRLAGIGPEPAVCGPTRRRGSYPGGAGADSADPHRRRCGR